MRTIPLVFLAAILLHPGGLGASRAASTAPGHAELAEMKRQLAEMAAEIRQMRREHAREIQALKDQIRRLQAPAPAAAQAPAKPAEPAGGDFLADLRRLAELEAAKEGALEDAEAREGFKARGLSLQALNPEISVTGDMIGLVRHQDGSRKRSDFFFRSLALHFESYLDPYTKFKATVPVKEDGTKLGEAYMTRFGVLEGLSVTIGKFRQQFGVVNRWHKHALDQVDFPLPLRMIFGDGGLNQTGFALDYTLPKLGEASQELTFQLTRGRNSRLFGGNEHNTPSLLLHYKNFRDLSKDTYAEWGATGLIGWNDEWSVTRGGAAETVHDSLSTRVFGADFSLLWEPTGRMRYRNVEWRSEAYLLSRDIYAPDASGRDTVTAWGAYTYVQSKVTRTLDVGLRLDYYLADSKDYDCLEASLAPLIYGDSHPCFWQVGPYLTWHQSPFVRYRLEYNHLDGSGMKDPEDVLMLQVIFAAGPHKHDRY